MQTYSEHGILNNYATEPAVYFAEFPSPEQKQKYAFQAAITGLFVAFTVLTALSVS